MEISVIINCFLQIYSDVLTYAVFAFALHYIFLEKKMPKQKQIRFNILFAISYLVAFVVQTILHFETAPLTVLVFNIGMGLMISMARTEHKIRGFFLAIPIAGLISGLISPFVSLPVNLFRMNEKEASIYQFVILTLFTVLFLAFYSNRGKLDSSIRIAAGGRPLRRWEKIILITIGVFMQILAALVVEPLESWAFMGESGEVSYKAAFTFSVLAISIGAVFMCVTAISVIVAGNEQSFYHKKVNDMQFNVILLMADLVDSRDQNTGGHIRRSAKYVEIIAKRLKKMGRFPDILTDEYIENLIVAAPLHDIGKINVSDLILNKPGRFTDEEYEIMKSHAPLGRDVLKGAKKHVGNYDYINMAIQMAGYHHEWFDGNQKGYPDHLAGEEIPLCARIMAVADVFDALTSKRVYKDAMALQKAYEIIDAESGTHFDPDIVEAFFVAKDEIEEALRGFMNEGL